MPVKPKTHKPTQPITPRHKAVAERKTTAERGYGGRWQRSRAGYLRKHPLCAECQRQGRVTEATCVDHIVPHKGDMGKFWDVTNWQPLCKHCHDSHKQRLEKNGGSLGCDDSGVPIDPNHHWNT